MGHPMAIEQLATEAKKDQILRASALVIHRTDITIYGLFSLGHKTFEPTYTQIAHWRF